MTIHYSQKGKFFLLFLSFTMALFFTSCNSGGNEQADSTDDQTEVTDSQDAPEEIMIPNVLSRAQANVFMKNYINTKEENLDNGFYPGGFDDDQNIELQKVFAFNLNMDQRKIFFKELQTLANGYNDNVKIRISWAFHQKGIYDNPAANLIPIVSLVLADSTIAANYYPLQVYDQKLSGIKEGKCDPSSEKITPACAKTLVDGYATIQADSIVPDLKPIDFTQAIIPDQPDIITFYTFNTSVTKSILDAYKNENYTLDHDIFRLRLGRFINKNFNYICAVIQVEDVPNALDGDDDFEFARPCPKYCEPPNP
ncbi:MAG: hypothetical protein AAFO07_22245 [Bacteroidota bacterium]